VTIRVSVKHCLIIGPLTHLHSQGPAYRNWNTKNRKKISVLCNISVLNDKIEKNEMGVACGAYGGGEWGAQGSGGKPEGKRPLGRPRRRWEDNIKMDLREVGGCCEDWMELAQDRNGWRALVSTVMNLRVPKMRGIS